MKNAITEILKSPQPFFLLVVLALLLSVNRGFAQKGSVPNYELEINNLSRPKTINVFDINQRIYPTQKPRYSQKKRRSSIQIIHSLADSYLNQNKSKLGIEDLRTDFRLKKISKSPAGTHIHYQELKEGIPVYDSRIVVTVNHSDEVSFTTRSHYPNLLFRGEQSQIQPEQAIEQARNYLNVSGELRGPEKVEQMVFHSKTNGPLLTYQVEIPSVNPFGDWEVFVDALSGDIIHVKNLIIYKNGTSGTGMVWDPDPLTTGSVFYGGDYSDNDDQDHDSLNAQRSLVTLEDLYMDIDGNYLLEGPYVKLTNRDPPFDQFPIISDSGYFNYTRAEQEFEAVMVYYHIDQSYRRLLELGFFTEDTVEGLQEFEADPHGNYGLDNSYYSPILNYCAFGEGGVDDAEDAAVIWHEYEHAIQYNISDISYNSTGETRSLLEGCSDYWAASYNRRKNLFGWNHVFLWDAGISSAEGDTTFWAGRRCDLDWRYSKEDSALYAGTHAFGQIWSSTLMQVWNELGAEITDRLFIASHYYWGVHPDFNTAAEAFIQSDIDIYDGLHLPIILHWFENYNLIDLQEYQPHISHDPISDIERMVDRYLISCQIIPSMSALDSTNLWLIWSLDSSFADSSHLIADSIDNFYSAEIPNVIEPSVINYYFYARDSLGIFSNDPVNAPQDYYSFYAGSDSLPPPPLNVMIMDSINFVDIRWEEIITGKYVAYHIHRSEDGINFFIVDSTSSSSLIDTTVTIGNRYYYYITTVFNQWESTPSDTVDALVQAITGIDRPDLLPAVFQLKQNYPNPFNPATIINYELPITNYVELSVYNLLGQRVATLISEKQEAGYYQIDWDASGFASGVYYYLIQAGEFRDVKKMILLR